jgi:L-iditol 2-dehydrogenase
VHLECSGSTSAALSGINKLAPLGISVLVGMGASDDLGIPVSTLQERELRITGIFRYMNCYPLAIELLATDKVSGEELITGRFPLSDASMAIRTSGQRGTIKNIVHPNR